MIPNFRIKQQLVKNLANYVVFADLGKNLSKNIKPKVVISDHNWNYTGQSFHGASNLF